MTSLFSKRVLYLIPVVFLVVIFFRITYAYQDAQERKYDFALKEAEVLNSYAMTHRIYYQELFINKTIHLTEQTLPALPAFSSYPISKEFSQNNKFNITIRTVSDKARNPENNADIDELKAIDYFNKNTKKLQYFDDSNSEFYQYAYPLRVKEKCLSCHGKKENSPLFIQEKYANSYNYKLDELRGIQSIKVPKKILNIYFMEGFFHSVVYDFILFLALFIGIFILLKKLKNINEHLEEQVDIQTKKLKATLIIDNLTLLPNRIQLLEDLEKTKHYKSRHLALLNVNSFKDINDFYGHDIGDLVLKNIALTIHSLCDHKSSSLYKLPSDEFAIFTTKTMTEQHFVKLVKDIVKKLQEKKIDAFEHSIIISLSAGISSNRDSLLAKADMALKSAKYGVNNIVLYDESIDNTNDILENIHGIMLIKDAIAADRLVPFFQPIYHIGTKKIQKYEALVRIIEEDGTILPPYKFLDIAIKSKIYPQITKIMVTKTFDFFIDKEFEFSINLSIEDILNKKTTSFILKKLKEFPHPEKVVFEILESDKIDNYKGLKQFIVDIKEYGCKFAIDDFGSGYSNFSHLLELNIDYLKIDSSLVKFITSDENSKIITKTIIDFAATLGLETIAEYVEDKKSLDLLQEMGIDYVQGYYIGKPDIGLNTTFK